ncbi:MAG TPA: DUF2182 domain-containing protein, partial [Acidimicrobiia bacterium]|nr:DUF2182 domain-containing protein [Acidimicrobiia bacterium]
MTGLAARRPLVRATPQAAGVLLLAAAGWALTVPRALDMGSTPGTMGMSLAAFLVMWSLMMAAMMLPAIAAVTGLYVRTFTDRPWARTAQLTGGYLVAWAAAGIPLFLLARLADHAPDGAHWPRWLAAAIFATAGAWQLSGVKDRCLR